MANREKGMDEPFLAYADKVYTGLDFVRALEELGVKRGDTVCVQSQLYSLGKSLIGREDFMKTIVYAIQYAIGVEGTLLMPAFSYSFCKGIDYNVQSSSSDVGILTEYFRRMPDVYRTKHPIFSFSIWGKRVEEFLSLPITSFNEKSVYGHMISGNDKLLFLGAPVGYTFYYTAEEHVGVSYRFYKYFEGKVVDDEEEYMIRVPYYVRKLDKRSTESERKINDFLFKNGYQNRIDFSKGTLTLAETKTVFEKLVGKLREDEEIFLRDDENIL